MNVPQPDDDDHESSYEAITISVTSHLYTAMSVNTGVDSIARHSVSSATKKPVSRTDLDSHAICLWWECTQPLSPTQGE